MGKRLLVIDDEPGVANVIALVAGGLGFVVRVVNCPIRAIDAFIDFRPDLVILDMIMPEKDGIDVLNELLLTGLGCRIVLTSGLSEAYLRLAEGIARFHASEVAVLRKPFRRQELVNVLVPTEQQKPWRASQWLALSA
ncbi:MAG TPA: response regulator [Acetobacteraceae bacterium]|nr:response regulator [Acetobacteraceae bacterium]